MAPGVSVAFEEAVAAHRAGRLTEAERGYAAVVTADPAHSDAWQLLGLVRHRLGNPTEGLVALDRAVTLDPEHAPSWSNRGLVLQALGQLDEAAVSFRRAVRLRPGFAEPLINLARLLARAGDLDAALQAAEQAGDHPEALGLVGMLRLQRGDLDGAWTAWSAAFAASSDPAMGRALGQLALQRGRPDDAVAPLSVAYLTGAPVGPLLADALLQGQRLASDTCLGRLLVDPRVDAQRVQRAVRERLASMDIEQAAAHPLTVPWLENCLVQHPHDLARLPLWRQLARVQGLVSLAAALAVQAHVTEHADPVDAEELQAIEALPAGALRWALLACAGPVAVPDVPPLRTLHRVMVAEPADEAARVPTIRILAAARDATSIDVAAMYEANPYPRRVGVHRPEPVPLGSTLGPLGVPRPAGDVLRVLVAGAGTGQHPLQTATRYRDVDVLAIDLSRASLARASRVAEAHGVANVSFAQADLLGLKLQERFAVVESVGVLHHLADPMAGWRVLVDHLADDGVMRIGLYAERGRADVVAARALVQEWGLSADTLGLREARRRFLALANKHPAHPVVWSPDFPSLSGLRDLVFHVCEHRFTLPQLGDCLSELGLTFGGFQHSRPQAALHYRERWPEDVLQRDLSRWDEVEAAHPRSFSGMYVFWCMR